ncbi:uncharacterized protein [Amphiura filiformis]|uniref:uncharacterized protein n=1 Tax=Amphiura filiformis TaxID=82378 RepID=UPI003B21C73F
MFGRLLLLIVCIKCVCSVSISQTLQPPCDLKDAYGYENIPNNVDGHDWFVVSGTSSPDSIPTGDANSTGNCYMLHKPDNADEGETALLFSSCYSPNDLISKDISLRFVHVTYGQHVGALNVYIRQGCVRLPDWPTSQLSMEDDLIWHVWGVVGSQANAWAEVQLTLDDRPSSAGSFQILFEAVVGNSSLSHIALDDISINGATCFMDTDFFCDNSSCIPDDWVCDQNTKGGLVDCIDGTDETETTCCDPRTFFMCNNGRCIERTKLCDGVRDCARLGESEDEAYCPGSTEARAEIPTSKQMNTTNAIKTPTENSTPTQSSERASISTEIQAKNPRVTTSYALVSQRFEKDESESSKTSSSTTDMTTTVRYMTGVTMKRAANKTFCDSYDIIAIFDNCTFIGIFMVIAIIFIIAAICLSIFTYNRYFATPRKPSVVTDSSYVETLSNVETHQDQNGFITTSPGLVYAAVMKTITQTGQETDGQCSLTFNIDPHGKNTHETTSKTNEENKKTEIDEDNHDIDASVEIATTGLNATAGNMVVNNEENALLSNDKPCKAEQLERPYSGYSSIDTNPSEGSAKSPANRMSSAYEDVNLGDLKPSEERRPTLPGGHPSLETLIEDKPEVTILSKRPAGVIPRLTSIAENVSNESQHGQEDISLPENVYSESDEVQNMKLDSDVNKREPDKRKSSCYAKINDNSTVQAQEGPYVEITKTQSETRRPTLPQGHPSFGKTLTFEDSSDAHSIDTIEDTDIMDMEPSDESANGRMTGQSEFNDDANLQCEMESDQIQNEETNKSLYCIHHSALVDHRSKVIEVPGTSVILDIPEGALADGDAFDVALSVYWGDEFYPPLENNQFVIGPSVCCEPHNTNFLKPVTLTIPHSAGIIASRNITVWTNTSQQIVGLSHEKWRLLLDGVADHNYENVHGERISVCVTEKSVKIRISHFSWFTALLSYFTGTQALQMAMIPYMNPPYLRDADIIYIKLYALREDQPMECIESQEKKVCGVQCGEVTPFLLHLNEADIICQMKIINEGNKWNPMEDQTDISYEGIRHGKYAKCTFTLRKTDMDVLRINGQINAHQAEKHIVKNAIFASQMVAIPKRVTDDKHIPQRIAEEPIMQQHQQLLGNGCPQRPVVNRPTPLRSARPQIQQSPSTSQGRDVNMSERLNSGNGGSDGVHPTEPPLQSLQPFKMRERGSLTNPFLEIVARGILPKWRDLAFKLGFSDDDCEDFESGDNFPAAFWPAFRMLDHFRSRLSENEVRHGKRILADAIQSLDTNLHDKIVNWGSR